MANAGSALDGGRKAKTSIWVSKELRDRLAQRAKWEQPLAQVIEEVLRENEVYRDLDRQGKSNASRGVLALAS